jgi:hypothetical protein
MPAADEIPVPGLISVRPKLLRPETADGVRAAAFAVAGGGPEQGQLSYLIAAAGLGDTLQGRVACEESSMRAPQLWIAEVSEPPSV